MLAAAGGSDRRCLKNAPPTDQLHYDPYERRSGLVRFLALDTDAEAWASARAIELGDAVAGAFEIEHLELDRLIASRLGTVTGEAGPAEVRVVKELVLGGDRRTPTLDLTATAENLSRAPVEVLFGLEWTLTMLGGGGNPSAWWEVDGSRMTHDSLGTEPAITTFAQGNDYVGVAVATTLSRPAAVWWAPVETVSNSEGGFERMYQGLGVLMGWPLALAVGESFTVSVSHVVTTEHDRTVEETTAASPVFAGA